MNTIKASRQGPVSYGLLEAMGAVPVPIEDRLIEFFTGKASLVLTNVPGPRERVRMAGVPVGGVLVWAPCAGAVSMSVSIFSYAGQVTVGFMVDAGLVPDPDELVDAFGLELAELRRSSRRPNSGGRSRTSTQEPSHDRRLTGRAGRPPR
jgi:diacylglycerol O-acyltransferase